ncbi:NAD(P)-binding domain protein [Metarhizium rileyi]|uniref:NAD(P)-binding domain protein n=1 Tax=Metarhizium rileyi (strain RCEF 4871) TaxID=1649241 RepID=A0A167DR60_METRR|nr:NAD(P)-binding domain protein [Metarhizium rileyi RCEF 4871]TWU77013.1 hypothetical protein ED733_007609 [Metarhizium rileyi]
MSTPWIFVCPSSRGIGFALTRHLLRTTSLPILATTRNPNPESTKTAILDRLDAGRNDALSSRLHLVPLDVTDPSSMEAASRTARELFPPDTHHLHMSFAIPGVLTPEKNAAQVDAAASLAMFRVNTVGPLLLMKYFSAFLPRRSTEMNRDMLHGLAAHATWLFMSARVGSIADNKSGGWFSYRASKAAVNSIAKSMDMILRTTSGENALAVAYHPGTVKTGLSKGFWGTVPQDKLFSPEYAAERMLSVVNGLGADQRGMCVDWRGEEIAP